MLLLLLLLLGFDFLLFLFFILFYCLFVQSNLLHYSIANLQTPLRELLNLLLVPLSPLHLDLGPVYPARVHQYLVKLPRHLLIQPHQQRLLRYLLFHPVHRPNNNNQSHQRVVHLLALVGEAFGCGTVLREEFVLGGEARLDRLLHEDAVAESGLDEVNRGRKELVGAHFLLNHLVGLALLRGELGGEGQRYHHGRYQQVAQNGRR